jgi:hypothetical protein
MSLGLLIPSIDLSTSLGLAFNLIWECFTGSGTQLNVLALCSHRCAFNVVRFQMLEGGQEHIPYLLLK